MSQPLPFDESEMWHDHPDLYLNKLEEILKTPDDSDIGCFVELDLRYRDSIKKKAKNFPFPSGNKVIPKDNYNDNMKKIRPKSCTKAKK